VTDISPGTQDYSITARFPDGVPAVSEESQSAWMKYVHMQFSKHTDATGVKVSLDTLDPNGNYVHIGDAVSDMSGRFSYQWIPQFPGKYTVYATFEGSNSYYASATQTAIAVDEIEPTPTSETLIAPSSADLYLLPGIIAIIATIVVVGLVLLLAIRKRA